MSDARPAAFDGASGAVFSTGRSYRYALWRTWQEESARVLFVGLNPSAADERRDDPTVRRCIAFARSWGYGGVLVGNLFACRTPDPVRLKAAADPVGASNDAWLNTLAGFARLVLACWGNHGAFRERDREFARRHTGLYCLRRNRNGSPAHPLYVPGSQLPSPWEMTDPSRVQQIEPH